MIVADALEALAALAPAERLKFSATCVAGTGPLLDAWLDKSAPTVAPGPGHDAALVAAFAQAIVKRGGKGLLLTSENEEAGWLPIDEAVATGHAFLVEPAPDILPVDCDQSELADGVWSLAAAVRLEGVKPVVVASGRPGHLHLFARIADPGLHQRYADRAKALGLDVRHAIRSPLAPHRLGLPVALLEPTDALEALAALAPPVARRPGPLSARMAHLLATGAFTAFGYRSRSEMLCALALAAVNVRWSFEDFVVAMLDRRNKAGGKLWTRRERSAREYLLVCWQKALRRSNRRPAVRDREAVLEQLAEIGVTAAAQPWNTRGGPVNLAVLEAHVIVAIRAGKLEYHADVRTLAEEAGVARTTVSRAERRLQREGWLRPVRRGGPREAGVWTVRCPRRTCTKRDTPISGVPGTKRDTLISPSGGDERSVPLQTVAPGNAGRVAPGADVWRWQGLGKAAMNTWRVLELELRPIDQLISRLGRQQRSVQHQLMRLESLGLARREGDRWCRGDADPAQVAQALGVAGVGQEQHARHEREREHHREGLVRRDPTPRAQKVPER